MNRMEEVAKLFGVKLDEEFKVYRKGTPIEGSYRFDEYGLAHINREATVLKTYDSSVLVHLLCGRIYEMKRLPWKPKKDDEYWVVLNDGLFIRHHYWNNDCIDYSLYYAGNCFATREEAEAHVPEVIGKLRRKYEEN